MERRITRIERNASGDAISVHGDFGTLSIDTVIQHIESDEHTYFVQSGDGRSYVEVTETNGRRHLSADDSSIDELPEITAELSMPEVLQEIVADAKSLETHWAKAQSGMEEIRIRLDDASARFIDVSDRVTSSCTSLQSILSDIANAESQTGISKLRKEDSKTFTTAAEDAIKTIPADDMDNLNNLAAETKEEVDRVLNPLRKDQQELYRKLNRTASDLSVYVGSSELGKHFNTARSDKRTLGLKWHYIGVFFVLLGYFGAAIFSAWKGFTAGAYMPLLPVSIVLGLLAQQIIQKARADEDYRHKSSFLNTYPWFSRELDRNKRNDLADETIKVISKTPISSPSSSIWWPWNFGQRNRSQESSESGK